MGSRLAVTIQHNNQYLNGLYFQWCADHTNDLLDEMYSIWIGLENRNLENFLKTFIDKSEHDTHHVIMDFLKNSDITWNELSQQGKCGWMTEIDCFDYYRKINKNNDLKDGIIKNKYHLYYDDDMVSNVLLELE